jgi:hypothetical protein
MIFTKLRSFLKSTLIPQPSAHASRTLAHGGG